MSSSLSHIDARGNAQMVDVSSKPETRRQAVAEGHVRMRPQTLELVRQNQIAKGDVLTVARVAGILAAKQASALIPMCHPLLLTDVAIELELDPSGISIQARVDTVGRTGAEMEALTAVSLAALTIYDMCKAVDREMIVDGVRLVRKVGGRSDWERSAEVKVAGGSADEPTAPSGGGTRGV